MFTMIKVKKDTQKFIKHIAKERGMTIYGYVDYLVNKDMLISAKENRRIKESVSKLPYSFKYKIRQEFNRTLCPICNVLMNINDNLTCPTIQHNKPLTKGGLHEIDNISVICRSCNTSTRNKETGKLNNELVIKTWERLNEVV